MCQTTERQKALTVKTAYFIRGIEKFLLLASCRPVIRYEMSGLQIGITKPDTAFKIVREKLRGMVIWPVVFHQGPFNHRNTVFGRQKASAAIDR
jgi:hypothetical protein